MNLTLRPRGIVHSFAHQQEQQGNQQRSSYDGKSTGKANRRAILGKVQRRLKSKKFVFCALALVAFVMSNMTLTEKQARQLLEERHRLRELITIDKGGGACDIGSPVQDAINEKTVNSTTTLLASYPGSGKRFTWTIIKALTNYEVADDWNFSGKLHKNPLNVKTSWPHGEGIWTWGREMDQVLLLLRNPRKAIPSYHTIKWELDYCTTWIGCKLRIPDTYMERPTVARWESWRDGKAKGEIDAWFRFYKFWMQAGHYETINYTHFRCNVTGNPYIDCQPKQVIDFENLYSDSISDDFQRIGDVLDSSNDVDVIANAARACVLRNVYNRTGHQDLNMHQASRPFPERPDEYVFTLSQFDRIMNRTIELINHFSEDPWSSVPHADRFVSILNRYVNQNTPEFLLTIDEYLEDHVNSAFRIRDADCNALLGNEVTICNFIKYRQNHDIFSNGYYPHNYPYRTWLEDRANLLRLYLNNGGSTWTNQGGWFSTSDHCTWEGVTCPGLDEVDEFLVTELSLPNNLLVGTFPSDLKKLNALQVLDTSGNSLVGTISNNLCGVNITGDAINCPNSFDGATGVYLAGCCDNVLVDVDIYLAKFAQAVLGSSNCGSLGGTEADVCNFMSNKANHAVFDSGYPTSFNGDVWDWLKERAVLARMFFNNGGTTWTDNSGWLGSGDHCTWAGVSCSASSSVTVLSMNNNQLTGSFPDDLGSLGSLQTLAASGNSLAGSIPNDLCSRPMSITGDAINCPNSFDGATGVYLAGCCDNLLVDVDIYLAEFAQAVLGSSNCGSLGGTESDVCNFMSNKANHAVFNSGYPTSFNGDVWDWLKERAVLARLFFNNGGTTWTNNIGWLGSGDHCTWAGVLCSASSSVTALELNSNNVGGTYPSDLVLLGSLSIVNLGENTISGGIPNDLCDLSINSGLYITGDAINCPNPPNQAGCCDVVVFVATPIPTSASTPAPTSNPTPALTPAPTVTPTPPTFSTP